jgi:oligoendopeptidase F
VNYRGSLENVFQLAHEIGHAVHAHIAHQAQPFVYTHPSTLTGETVAAVFEGALVDRMTGGTSGGEEKPRVLDLAIQNILHLFYRPMLDADFELRIYDTEGAITGPTLGALYLSVVEEFYGETVSLDDWDAHTWQQTPHYFTSPLYMGKYGLSSAAANILISQLTSATEAEAAAARRALLELMSSGSSGYPLELLRAAGANPGDPGTIDVLITRLEELVDELEQTLSAP